MLHVNTVNELKAAIEAEMEAKATEIVEIFQREFPGSSLGIPDEPYSSWAGGDDIFSSTDEFLSKYLSLNLPSNSETLIVLEFGLSEEREASTVHLQHILLNCFLHSRIFSDHENPLYICSSGEGSGSWDVPPPSMAKAYERVVGDLLELLSNLRFHFELSNGG